MALGREDSKQKDKRVSPSQLWLYLVFGLLLLGWLAWGSLRVLRESPSRQVSLQVPGRGWLTLTLMTDPSPPRAGQQFEFNLRVDDPQHSGLSIANVLPYQIGAQGGQTLVDGITRFDQDADRYYGQAQFSEPGNYWLDFNVGQQTAHFQLYIEP